MSGSGALLGSYRMQLTRQPSTHQGQGFVLTPNSTFDRQSQKSLCAESFHPLDQVRQASMGNAVHCRDRAALDHSDLRSALGLVQLD